MMSDAEREYWIAEGRALQITDDIKQNIAEVLAGVERAIEMVTHA